MNVFRLKYNCLPGDCANATDFFGAEPACPLGSTRSGTCNGNGDGIIDETICPIDPVTGAFQYCEPFRFWQQLGLGGLIPGAYTGIQILPYGPPDYGQKQGVNVPC
jgi:hypothetical protein